MDTLKLNLESRWSFCVEEHSHVYIICTRVPMDRMYIPRECYEYGWLLIQTASAADSFPLLSQNVRCEENCCQCNAYWFGTISTPSRLLLQNCSNYGLKLDEREADVWKGFLTRRSCDIWFNESFSWLEYFRVYLRSEMGGFGSST